MRTSSQAELDGCAFKHSPSPKVPVDRVTRHVEDMHSAWKPSASLRILEASSSDSWSAMNRPRVCRQRPERRGQSRPRHLEEESRLSVSKRSEEMGHVPQRRPLLDPGPSERPIVDELAITGQCLIDAAQLSEHRHPADRSDADDEVGTTRPAQFDSARVVLLRQLGIAGQALDLAGAVLVRRDDGRRCCLRPQASR